MHPFEQGVYDNLDAIINGKEELDEKLLEEFGERCKSSVRQYITEFREKQFRLRMSNIGRPLRQLMLEKLHGLAKPSPFFLLKMLLGSLYEALFLLLFKSAKVGVSEHDKLVQLKTKAGTIEGTFDVKINGKIYDFKTASDYSYNNKFRTWESLINNDDFGYAGQGFGYALADGGVFGGWVVVNKSTGDFKVVELPERIFLELKDRYFQEIESKVAHVNANVDIPPCDGVIPETYYKKPSGNTILGPKCRFCPHKEKCHNGISYKQSKVSKSENKYEWYVTEVQD